MNVRSRQRSPWTAVVQPAMTAFDIPLLIGQLTDQTAPVSSVVVSIADANGDYAAVQLAEVASSSSTLRELALHQSAVGLHGCHALASALATHGCALATLSLVGNRVGDNGAARLASALCDGAEAGTSNRTLRTLCLDHNAIGDAGAKALACMLARNSSLTALSLESNRITESGAASLLASLLGLNTTLQDLKLGGNCDLRGCLPAIELTIARNRAAAAGTVEVAAISDEDVDDVASVSTSSLPSVSSSTSSSPRDGSPVSSAAAMFERFVSASAAVASWNAASHEEKATVSAAKRRPTRRQPKVRADADGSPRSVAAEMAIAVDDESSTSSKRGKPTKSKRPRTSTRTRSHSTAQARACGPMAKPLPSCTPAPTMLLAPEMEEEHGELVELIELIGAGPPSSRAKTPAPRVIACNSDGPHLIEPSSARGSRRAQLPKLEAEPRSVAPQVPRRYLDATMPSPVPLPGPTRGCLTTSQLPSYRDSNRSVSFGPDQLFVL